MEDNKEYNDIPVSYCKKCLSLKVMVFDELDESLDYCDDCGNTEIGTTDIETWQRMYIDKYNKPF